MRKYLVRKHYFQQPKLLAIQLLQPQMDRARSHIRCFFSTLPMLLRPAPQIGQLLGAGPENGCL
ncbi:hypothetical protein AVM11_14770 [Sphingomonas melonis TY]|uniref:Uncharacterized protein n=2 Tax=Sphingomonas melonis TaxID=152682 RepID=A0A0D1MJW4_9SPHN|nr:hypothetical protein BJP26_06735 [Sphingomonas melonis TY]ATI56752.1 hypothetical protein CP552_13975 [Sphingomonas melonis]MBI0533608.1 hypothetical protein [Sphingomonas sp. TX0522]MCP4027337.1 hypothetical protein [Sphingomonas sp.]KIU27846.1 hypothetical protein SR41_09715 [Sphingomonas melonis]